MARARRLEIQIVGDSTGGTRALGQIESRMSKTGRAFGRFGRAASIGIGAVAVAGTAAVVAVGRDLANIERLNAQTRTAIKSSGGAANVTQRQVTSLAESIQAYSGIQQESIQEGSNLLLTFHNIRNEAGKGNDIFDRTTRTLADMSTAMGSDAASEAIRLGRALNDPVKGMQALTRVGVQFTDRQREWIEHLVETGDTVGAQRVILAELQREFGGSAAAFGETTAGQFARAKEAIMDVAEGLVVRLMPAVTTAVEWIRTRGIPVLEEWGEWLGPRLTAAFDTVSAWVRANWPQIQVTITDAITRVRDVVGQAVGFMQAAWNAFGDDILGHIQRHWPIVRQTIESVMGVIQGVIKTVTGLIKGDWGQVWNGIKQVFVGVWNGILATVRGMVNNVRTVLAAAWQVIRNNVTGQWGAIRRFFGNVWEGIRGGFRGMVDAIGGIFERLKSIVAAPVNWIIRNVVNPFLGLIRTVAGFVGLGGAIPGPFGSIGGGGTGGPGPSTSSGPGQHRGDGPGLEMLKGGPVSVQREMAHGTGDGIGIFAGGPQDWIMGASSDLAGMVKAISDAIAGFGRLLGMTGGPPPFKGVMGGVMKAPLNHALGWFRDLKKNLSAPTLGAGIGWEKMWGVLQAQFPGIQLFSAVRTGAAAITATGNASYHGMGRAVDISPWMHVFDWLVANYGAQSKEIIFSPAGNRQIHNGSPHYYGEPTRGDHFDHIHWAMRNGGTLTASRPTVALFGEGGPERATFEPLRGGRPAHAGTTVVNNFDFSNAVIASEQQLIGMIESATKHGYRSPALEKAIGRRLTN